MLGILCGLEDEAVLARQVPDAEVLCSAARPEQALEAAQALCQRGATRVLSFGLAGGLEPGLPTGAIVIGTGVRAKGGFAANADPAGCLALRERLPEARFGIVWGANAVIATPREKQELYQSSHCRIVDMESEAVVRAAARAGVSAAILRVVLDPWNLPLPPAALCPLRENGKPDMRRILASLLRDPSQLPDLLSLRRKVAAAFAVLAGTIPAVEGGGPPPFSPTPDVLIEDKNL